MAKKWFVIDTSVYLSDSDCLTRFGNNDIIVPLKVLEEIVKLSKLLMDYEKRETSKMVFASIKEKVF